MTGATWFICVFNVLDTLCPLFFSLVSKETCTGIGENSCCMESAACLKHCSFVGGRLEREKSRSFQRHLY